jgi:hypothetical protein
MDLAKMREFILGAYHDLPNILLVGSLLFGSIAGYRPLLWISLGLFANLAITYPFQLAVTQFVKAVPSMEAYFRVQHRGRCAMFTETSSSMAPGVLDAYAPSWWVTSAFFFITFTIWNGLTVLFNENPNATMDQKNNRRAYGLSVLLISGIIGLMALSRTFDGCETAVGTLLGACIGGLWSVIYWKILDACGTGITPDVLLIIQNSAPMKTGKKDEETPIVCA